MKPITDAEWHAINHARCQVADASPDNPDCGFDFELVRDLLNVIDRFALGRPEATASTKSEGGTEGQRSSHRRRHPFICSERGWGMTSFNRRILHV